MHIYRLSLFINLFVMYSIELINYNEKQYKDRDK